MNIYLKELKTFRFQALLWSSIISFVAIFYLLLYPTFYENKQTFIDLLSAYPPEVIEALGFNAEQMFTPMGFYCFLFSYLIILGAFEAAIIGIKVIRSDQVENAESFMFTKPVTRRKIFTSKLLAGLTCITFSNILLQIVSFIGLLIFSSENFSILTLIQINLGLLFIQIAFLGIAMVIGAFTKSRKAVNLVAVITILFFYILHVVEDTLDLTFLRYFNPFSYFKPEDILSRGGYSSTFMVASVFIIFFCVNFSYSHYENMDIIKG